MQYLKISKQANYRLVVGLGIFLLSSIGIIYASDWSTSIQVDFDDGGYSDTIRNTDHVGLSNTKTVGTYISKIFDVGGNTDRNNISWTQGGYYQQELPNNQGSEIGNGGVDMTDNILLYHLNDAAGAIVDDSSNGYNGSYNGALYSQVGKFNTSIGFDGSNDYIDTNLDTQLSSLTGFSVFSWVKDIPSGNHYVVSQAHNLGSYSSDWILGYQNGGLWFRTKTIDGSNIISDGDRHNLGFTFDGTKANLYIDGVLIGSSTPTGFSATGTVKVMTRGDAASSYAAGEVDELAIYSKVLTATEILDIYKRGADKLDLSVRSCNDIACDTETRTNLSDTSPQNIAESANRYFQYRYNFTTDNVSYSPEIYNVTVNYDAVVTPALSFTDDIEAGPVTGDTIAVSRTNATIKKREYNNDGNCSTVIGDYSHNYTADIIENTETNNTKYICFYGESNLGNITTLSTANDINIDITNPAYAGVVNGEYYNTNKSPTYSDANTVTATLNGLGFNSGDPISVDDSYSLVVTDEASNQVTVNFTIDKIDPVYSGVIDNAYYNIDKTITYSDTNIKGATMDTVNFPSGSTVTIEGSHTLVVNDRATNSATATFTIDKTVPTVSGVSDSVYYNTNVTITYSDANINSATLNGLAYVSGTPISSDGNYIFYVDDLAGNSKTVNFTIDKTKPTASVSYNPSLLTNTDVLATLTGESEVITIDSVGGNTHNFTANGTFLFEFHDVAGNTGENLSTVNRIDKSAPTWIINDGTASGPIHIDTINVTAADSNLDAGNLLYGFSADNSCDGSDTYSNPFTNSTDFDIAGDHTDYLCAKSNDTVGNTSYQLVGQLNTDNTAPVISFIDDVNIWPTQSDSIAATRGDAIVKKWEYNIDATCPTNLVSYTNNYTSPFTQDTETNNSKYICLYAEDSIGNKATLASANDLNIDITKPTASVSYNPSSLTNTDVLATLTGESENIIVDSIGGSTHNFTINGTFLFEFHDVAGNTGENLSTVNRIDKIPPELTGTSIVTTSNTNTGFSKVADTVVVTFDVTEDLIQNPSVNIVGGGGFTLSNKIGNTYSYIHTMLSSDPEGIIDIAIAIEDLATNINSDTVVSNIIFDRTDPSGIVITAPTLEQRLKGSNGVDPSINFNITRNVGAEVNYGTNPIKIYYSSLGDFSDIYTISAGTDNDGAYSWAIPANYNTDTAMIKLIATDAAGNSNTFNSSSFNIDSIKPTEVTITTPDGLEFLKGGDEYDLSYAGGVESNIATQEYWLSYNGGLSSQAISIHAGNKRYVPSNINIQDIVFNIKVTDKAGWRNDGNSNTFTIDNTKPVLTFINNSIRRNTSLDGDTTVSDNFALRLTGNNAVYSSNIFIDNCDGGVLTVPSYISDGTYTSYACVEDRAGNVTTGQQIYNIDKTNPFVDPGSDKITNTGIFQGTVVNDIISGGVISDIDTIVWSKVSGPGVITFNPINTGNTDISADTDGIYTLRLTAIDNAGNISTGDIIFTRDTSSPIITGGSIINTSTANPGYSFQSNETGAVSYSGSCGNGNISVVSIGTNTFNYSSRGEATYDDCNLIITDLAGNQIIHNIPIFTVNFPAPSGGGGGGGGGITKDNCRSYSKLPGANKQGNDYSPSNYDRTCLSDEDEEVKDIIKDAEDGGDEESKNIDLINSNYGNNKTTILDLIVVPSFDDKRFNNSMLTISQYIAEKVAKKSIKTDELVKLISYYNTFLSKFADYKNYGNNSAKKESIVSLSTFMSKLNKYPNLLLKQGDELDMAIQFLYKNGLTKYSTKATFWPNALITREQAAKFLVGYAQKVKGKEVNPNKKYVFTDINDGDVSLKDYVLKSYQMGIFNGYGSVFKPHRNLTKGGALAVLFRIYLGKSLNEYNNPWYKEYYNKALDIGLTVDKNLRSGLDDITRGELALFIYRISQK